MALNKILSLFQFNDDDDFEDDDDEIEEVKRQPRRTTEQSTSTTERYSRAHTQNESFERPARQTNIDSVSEYKQQRQARSERLERSERPERAERAASKVVPIKSTRTGLEVTVTKPSSFDDSQDICDLLISGKAVVANLEGFDPLEAQRIMDFISGCVYAMNGNLHQISKYIFIFSPDNVDISGDFLDSMSSQGFGVPTINREF